MSTLPFSFPGFAVQQVWCGEAALTITACATKPTANCPSCQQVSRRIHSYYRRSPQDLPMSGQTVHLLLQVRRFRCQNQQCPRHTFAERVPEVLPVHARRTARLEAILDLVAVARSRASGRTSCEPDGNVRQRRYPPTLSQTLWATPHEGTTHPGG